MKRCPAKNTMWWVYLLYADPGSCKKHTGHIPVCTATFVLQPLSINQPVNLLSLTILAAYESY